MHCQIFLAMLGASLLLGYPGSGVAHGRQALAAADESEHPFTLTDGVRPAPELLHQFRGEAGPKVIGGR